MYIFSEIMSMAGMNERDILPLDDELRINVLENEAIDICISHIG